MIKGQDIVVLAALMDSLRQKDTYAELGAHVCLSASETHAAVNRLIYAALITADHRALKRNAMRGNLPAYEFLLKQIGQHPDQAQDVSDEETGVIILPPILEGKS